MHNAFSIEVCDHCIPPLFSHSKDLFVIALSKLQPLFLLGLCGHTIKNDEQSNEVFHSFNIEQVYVEPYVVDIFFHFSKPLEVYSGEVEGKATQTVDINKRCKVP